MNDNIPASAMPDIDRRWRRGRAILLGGCGLLAFGMVAYLVADPIDGKPNGLARVLSLWPFGVLILGAVVLTAGQMYLSATECPACREPLRTHLSLAGVVRSQVPIRFCPRCGADVRTGRAPATGAG